MSVKDRITCTYHTTKTGHEVKLDIILPSKYDSSAEKELPLAICFHGGGLFNGSRRDPNFVEPILADGLNAHGCICIYPDYRLLDPSTLWDELEDITVLSQFIESDAFTRLLPQGITPDLSRVVFAGFSAGSYMARMATIYHLKAYAAKKSRILPKACVLFFGMGGDILLDHWLNLPEKQPVKPKYLEERTVLPEVSDLPYTEGIAGHDAFLKRQYISDYWWSSGKQIDLYTGETGLADRLRALPYSEREASLDRKYEDIIPQLFLSRSELAKQWPATILIHGDKDPAVPYEESLYALKQLQDRGVKVKLITVKNGNHNLEDEATMPDITEKEKAVRQLTEELMAMF